MAATNVTKTKTGSGEQPAGFTQDDLVELEADSRLRATVADSDGRSLSELVARYPGRWRAILAQVRAERKIS